MVESAFKCRGHGFDPWSGRKIPHATEQLSLFTTTREACMPQRPNVAKYVIFFKEIQMANERWTEMFCPVQ